MERELTAALVIALTGCQCGGPIVGLDGGGDASGADANGEGPDAGPDGGGSACPGAISGSGWVMAGNLNHARRVAADSTHLYVTERGQVTMANGRLLRINKNGGLLEEIATALDSPDGVAADVDAIYVMTRSGLVRVVRADGGVANVAPIVNNALRGDTEVLIEGTYVYATTAFPSLIRFNKEDGGWGAIHTADAGAAIRGAAIDGAGLYFLIGGTAGRGLWHFPLDLAGSATLVRGDIVEGRSLALTPSHYYWTEGFGSAGRVRRAGRTGSEPETLATAWGPTRLRVATNHVYFKQDADGGAENTGFLRRISLCGTPVVDDVGPTGIGPGGLLLESGILYFTSQQSGGFGYLGRVP